MEMNKAAKQDHHLPTTSPKARENSLAGSCSKAEKKWAADVERAIKLKQQRREKQELLYFNKSQNSLGACCLLQIIEHKTKTSPASDNEVNKIQARNAKQKRVVSQKRSNQSILIFIPKLSAKYGVVSTSICKIQTYTFLSTSRFGKKQPVESQRLYFLVK